MKKIEKSKEILPSTYRIEETIFTSMAGIGGRLFSNHPKNLNHVHKDSKDLFSFIITLGKYISGVYTVFYDGLKTSDFGSRAHVLNNLHGRMICVLYKKYLHGKTFSMDQTSFFHVKNSRHGLYSPSNMFSLHHKTQCLLHLYFPPEVL